MEVEQGVNEVIATILGIPEADILPDHYLVEDLGADSLDATEIAMGIEEAFCIIVPDYAMEKIHLVSDIYDMVKGALHEIEKK